MRQKAPYVIVIITLAVLAVFFFVERAYSAEYEVRTGDSWHRIASNITKATGLRHTAEILRQINPEIQDLRPRQTIHCLSLHDIKQAEKWLHGCLAAGFQDEVYTKDLANLKAGIIKVNAIRRLLNYAEAAASTTPTPKARLTALRPSKF